MRAARAAQKLSQIIFFQKNIYFFLLIRFLFTWEALIHSILICEVKDTRSHVLQALWKIPKKKNFEVSS